MSIGLKRKDPAESIIELSATVVNLRHELRQMQARAEAAEGQLAKDPSKMWWVTAKAHRQRDALDLLNRRVVSQRLALRTLEQLGRGLTKAEYQAARDAISDEKLRERIEKEYTVTI